MGDPISALAGETAIAGRMPLSIVRAASAALELHYVKEREREREREREKRGMKSERAEMRRKKGGKMYLF